MAPCMECNDLYNNFTSLKLKYRVAATAKVRPDDAILAALKRSCDDAQRALLQHESLHNPSRQEPKPEPAAAPRFDRPRAGAAILLPAAS